MSTFLFKVLPGLLAALPSIAQPTISALQNNFSWLMPGWPDYGIARGSIFVLYGRQLGPADLLSASSFPLAGALGGVTITISGADGARHQAIPYYVSATQIGAVLPSAVPAGEATVSVTYNGRTSSPFPLSVAQTAFGILTRNGAGSGPAAAFDSRNNFLTAENAVHPGEVFVLWGTGLGPASGDEMQLGGTSYDLGAQNPITVWIGGQRGIVQYHGRSQYPGLDQINVMVPDGVSGCEVPVEVKGERLVSNLVTIPVAPAGSRTCADQPLTYSETPVNAGDTEEHRFFAAGRHFLTVLLDARGALAVRPHPGVDVNGWGTSVYLQPFLPGATLRSTRIGSITASGEGISLSTSGVVSDGGSGNSGTWDATYRFRYNPGRKEVSGEGSYNIRLSAPLTSDLNLLKIASNYLTGVPLLGGVEGNTGDVLQVNVSGGPLPGFVWVPSDGSTYPQDHRNPLSVELVGNYYRVDAAAQGYSPIEAAYKPTIKAGLSCGGGGYTLIFGAAYETSQSRQYWQDNVAVTPIVLKSSPLTGYSCQVTLTSTAIAGDH